MYQQDPLTTMLSIIRNGLEKSTSPKKIIIIGAGLSGLISASLLRNAGHDIVILEASNRVGGRVFTVRKPFSEGLKFEAGAKRIPSDHHLIWEYIKKFKLHVNEFINTTPNDLLWANGLKARRWYYEENPDYFQYKVTRQERGKTASELLQSATLPLQQHIKRYAGRDIPKNLKYYPEFTLDTFLRHNPFGQQLSPGAIEKVKVMMGVQGFSEYDFFDVIRSFLPIIILGVNFYEIADGNDQLPRKLQLELQHKLFFNEKVTKISPKRDSVTVSFENMISKQRTELIGDIVIVSIPFSALQLVKIDPIESFSMQKRRAIRELRYIPATKVGIEFKSRFWEKDGFFGGHTLTDLPTRFTYYPSPHIGTYKPGIVLGSYTLGADTLPWDSQPEEDRIQMVLDTLANIHGNIVYEEFVQGVSKVWRQDQFISGDISVFKAGIAAQIAPFLATPEGRVHFTGEHTSSYPAWMEGGIESGIRVAKEVNEIG